MFWFIYLASSLLVSLIIARVSKDYFFELSFILMIFFLTPAQIEITALEYSPSVFAFIFNVVFEQDFSTRVLRPLLISIPLGFLVLIFYLLFKKRFV